MSEHGSQRAVRPVVQLRTYRHFKGGVYRVLFTAKDCESEESVLVYENVDTGSRWVRSEKDFEALVTWPDDKIRPRFVPI